jgi:AIPR protein
MSTDREFQKFVQQVNAETRDRALAPEDGRGVDFKENAFTGLVLEVFEESGITANGQLAYHNGRWGRGTVKVNGYAINDAGDVLDLFSTIFMDAEEPVTLPKSDVAKAAEQAARFFLATLDGLHEKLEASSEAAAMARHIDQRAPEITRVRIFILSDGVTSAPSVRRERLQDREVLFEIWDAERLFRGMQPTLGREKIVVDFQASAGSPIPCLPMQDASTDYEAYLAILPGEVLYKLYDEYGSRLLEFNVRSFLSARGKINSGIRRTLTEEPDRFLAYNNGIVVTVDELETLTLDDGRPAIRSLRGLQIVDGGQTTASIHRARKVDRVDISSVMVPAKITRIDPAHQEEVVRSISRYANTQNVIQMADFSANEPFHIEIERLSERIWCPGEQGRWFYERARGQYQVAKSNAAATPARRRRFTEHTPASRKFTKADLAKYENSWRQRPHEVSLGAQKNFDRFMQSLRDRFLADWLPDETYYRQLIAKAILFKAIDRIVRREGFPAYQANIKTYLMAYVAFRSGSQLDLDTIWNEQVISDELTELLRSWSHGINSAIIETAGARNVTEWCKKEDCWKAIQRLDLHLSSPLPRELANRISTAPGSATTIDGALTPDDLDHIALCKKVDGSTWFRIHEWGKRTGMLKDWEAGIAHTLSAYAASGWDRGPSPKQAMHGARIFRMAERDGVTSETTGFEAD